MDFKKTTRQHADRKYIQMLDGSTPPPYEGDVEIDASRTYSSKRDRYYTRLSQERSEFNSALSKVQSAEGARLRKEEADIEAKARSRYKLFKMLKTIAFLLPIVLVVFTGINIFSRNYYYVSSIDFESIWIFGMFASVILAIILIVSLYKKEIYYSRTNVKNGVKFSALAIIVTAVTILVGILFLSAKPSVSSKDDFVFIKGDRGCVLIEYKGDAEIVILPEKYEGESYQISYEAFSGDNVKSMTKLVIPATATGSCNFRNCTSLKDVEAPASSVGNLPKTIETLFINGGKGQMYADFRDYTSLKSLIIADTIESIQSDTFSGCTALETVVIGSGITSISSGMFEGCTSLTNLTIKGNASVGYSAFNGCNNIKNLTCHAGVLYNLSFNTVETVSIIGGEKIPSYAFKNCTLLKSVTISNSITSIESEAFFGCTGLESIIIPDNVTTIGGRAFSNCTALKSITIPDSVTSIGNSAFSGCILFESVTIPSSVKQMGNQTFYNCTNLKEVATPSHLIDCFPEETVQSLTINSGSSVRLRNKYNNGSENTTLKSVTILEGVTSIDEYAFYECTALESIVIPSGITSIGESAFYGCDSLVRIDYLGSLEQWCNISFENYASNPASIAQTFSINGTPVTELVIPSTITKINNYAFYNCESIKKVNYLGTIEQWCNILFDGYSSNPVQNTHCLYLNGTLLTELVIPDTITKINDYAFNHCASLISVTLPESLTEIGTDAFNDCNRLVEVYNLSSLNVNDTRATGYVGAYAKAIHTSLDEPSILETVNDFIFATSQEKHYLVAYTGSDTEITLPDFYKGNSYEINEDALIGEVTKVTIPSTVTKIGYGVFRDNIMLKSVVLLDGITSIEAYAFLGCSSLEDISIPDSVTSIGLDSFYNCPSLNYNEYDNAYYLGNDKNPCVLLIKAKSTDITSCDIHEKTKFIYKAAFLNCTSLESTLLPEGLISIDHYAFQNCTSLESVVIPDSVTTINGDAFQGCTSLKNVTLGMNLNHIGYSVFEKTALESAIFKDTEGWKVIYHGNGYTSNYTLSSSDLSNESIAAGYLSYTYYGYYWVKE